ncbi:hypothetical protein ACLQ2Q_20775 [Microbacterium sp. DT81.1]|uniref:hypothetical protein n=1 Tax=Microbacterium sp. DT81.1 TaxID=3393413 RepID=UPI003CE6A60B
MAAMQIDIRNGARLTSLTDASGFEWLWSRPDARRQNPGEAFVDAGGAEECFPTIAGDPDHGAVWRREWELEGATGLRCRLPDATITRHISREGDTHTLHYEVTAEPGYRFVWALHALVVAPTELRLLVPGGWPTVHWPRGFQNPERRQDWPLVHGTDISDVSVNDGTAAFFLLPGLDQIELHYAGHCLGLRLVVAGQPHGFGFWRNLEGYSWDGGPAYRSIGIEPMLGANPDIAAAQRARSAAEVPASGRLEWDLHISTSPGGYDHPPDEGGIR